MNGRAMGTRNDSFVGIQKDLRRKDQDGEMRLGYMNKQ
jgi:hypothetical protein